MGKSPNPVDVHVGNRVRIRRRTLSLSQTALADAVGITFQQIQKYENGKNRISSSRLQQIAHVLGVSVSFFFEELPDRSKASNAKIGVASANFALKFAASSEGLSLAKAFQNIKRRELRRSIVLLVKVLSGDD